LFISLNKAIQTITACRNIISYPMNEQARQSKEMQV